MLAETTVIRAIVNDLPANQPQLSSLLECCFPGFYAGRTFFKQEPHQRLLAYDGDKLAAHLGLDFRTVRVGDSTLAICGIIDLCVDANYRRQGLAAKLLIKAEQLAQRRDFMVLMADDDRLYQRQGYVPLPQATVRWLAIEELHSHSVIERDLSDILRVKAISGQRWPAGKIDLLGYLF